MKKNKNKEVESFNINSINQVMICADKDYEKFKEFVTHKSWNQFIPQYINPNIYDTLDDTS